VDLPLAQLNTLSVKKLKQLLLMLKKVVAASWTVALTVGDGQLAHSALVNTLLKLSVEQVEELCLVKKWQHSPSLIVMMALLMPLLLPCMELPLRSLTSIWEMMLTHWTTKATQL